MPLETQKPIPFLIVDKPIFSAALHNFTQLSWHGLLYA